MSDDDSDNQEDQPNVAIVGSEHFTNYRAFVNEVVSVFFSGPFVESKTGQQFPVGVKRLRTVTTTKNQPIQCASIVTGTNEGTESMAAEFARHALLPCTRISRQRSNHRNQARKLLVTAHFVLLFYDEIATHHINALFETIDEYNLPAMIFYTQTHQRTYVRCAPLDSCSNSVYEPCYFVLEAKSMQQNDSRARSQWAQKFSICDSADIQCSVRFTSEQQFNAHRANGFEKIAEIWKKILNNWYAIETPLYVIEETSDRVYQNTEEVVVFNIDAPDIAVD
jgi:hypothetical protein